MVDRNVLASLIMAALLAAAPAAATEVEVELSLVVDTSGSISDTEYHLQVDAYADLVRDSEVIPQDGTVAIGLVLFATTAHEAVPWTLVADAASAEALSDAIRTLPREEGGTALGEGLLVAARSFAGNGFEGRRRVIDVSGDGVVNTGTDIRRARDEALDLVDAINGLAITDGDPSLFDYYRDEVVGGESAFAFEVRDPLTFREALRVKLLRETGGCLPPPAGLVAWLALDETSGPLACDSAGGDPAWLQGCPTPVTGLVGGALAFDGLDDAVVVPVAPESDDLSLVLWVRLDAAGRQPLVDARDAQGGFALAVVDGAPVLTLAAPDGESEFVGAADVADGAWHLLAAVVTGGAPGGGAIFVDRTQVATFDAPVLAGGSAEVTLGADREPAAWLAGALDEVQLFDRALAAEEIAAIAEAGADGQCRWSPRCALGVDALLADACVWPPKHRLLCFTDFAALAPGLPTDAVVLACESNQPDEVTGGEGPGHGDGRAEPDCLVSADGSSFCLRSERQGADLRGRSYTVTLGVPDDCFGAFVAGRLRIAVPHDRGGADDCLEIDPHDFLLRHEEQPPATP